MRKILGISLVLGLAGATQPLSAQQIPSPYRYIEETMSLAFEAGYLATQSVEPAVGPRSAPLVGARFLVRIAGPASGEVALGFAPSQREIYENAPDPAGQPGSLVPTAVGSANMPIFFAEGGFRLHLTGPRTWNGLAPYASGTVGGAFNAGGRTAEEEEIPTEERFAFGPALAVGVGLGTDWFVAERISLRLDARNRLWRVATPGGFTQTGRNESTWTNNLGLTLGAAYHF